MNTFIPVITVDGPGGSGKGTISRLLAKHLHWHFLDSGALYRLLAYAAHQKQIALNDVSSLVSLAHQLEVVFDKQSDDIWLSGQEVSGQIRTEQCGAMASKVAAMGEVRAALLDRQRAFCQMPGLVADGRDMGTVVFPHAPLKLFLEASLAERAKRRQTQLKEQGLDVKFEDLLAEIAERDTRDRQRAVAPLKPAEDAHVIDTTHLSIEGVFQVVLAEVMRSGLGSI